MGAHIDIVGTGSLDGPQYIWQVAMAAAGSPSTGLVEQITRQPINNSGHKRIVSCGDAYHMNQSFSILASVTSVGSLDCLIRHPPYFSI